MVQKVVNSINISANEMVLLLCMDEVEGIENLKIEKMKNIGDTNFCSPGKANDIEEDNCLLLWKIGDDQLSTKCETLTHAEAFLLSMKACIGTNHFQNGVIDIGYPFIESNGVLLSLIALERKILCIIDELQTTKLINVKNTSPLQIAKPYSFKRSKINFTIEDFEQGYTE